MKTYIVFLRGINVGGHKKILMKDLSLLFESLGFENVKTYIQSGNVVFKAKERNTIAQEIEEAINNKYGWEVPTLVKSPSEIDAILKNCPFSEEKKVKSYFTFLFDTPSKEIIQEINNLNLPEEELIATKNCLYFYTAKGYGNTKYNSNFIERKLKSKATARNYRTMAKLLELSTL